jgi:hypothetical protein
MTRASGCVQRCAPCRSGSLEHFLGPKGKIEPTDDGFKIDATLAGESAKERSHDDS